ncbi:MAG: tRNA (adenosine(37)-N6)-dimethylallyltransferase MiaA [Ignavibacteriales bacterium]|nr:tRNA (adenosine(37)-N6)-dimethylallyltransferase MiaA [Ignavibacteriales bacterium]
MKTLLAIVGPTASGKTPLSLYLAEILGAEIVSADSRQIYKYLDIGTAKPSREDIRRVKHHFIDLLDPGEEYSAGRYGKEARAEVRTLLQKGKETILVGGSGLYVKALVDGLFDGPGRDDEIRKRLEAEMRREGMANLLEKLRAVDPVTADAMTRESKARRIIRALEVHAITGKPISQFHREQETRAPFDTLFYGLNWERGELYRLIEERVDRMIREGLIEEVQDLKMKGFGPHLNSLQTVGYKEVFSFLNGEISRQDAVDLIKQNTRRFAKRQLTWFKADKRIRWIPMESLSSLSSVAQTIAEEYKTKARRYSNRDR